MDGFGVPRLLWDVVKFSLTHKTVRTVILAIGDNFVSSPVPPVLLEYRRSRPLPVSGNDMYSPSTKIVKQNK